MVSRKGRDICLKGPPVYMQTLGRTASLKTCPCTSCRCSCWVGICINWLNYLSLRGPNKVGLMSLMSLMSHIPNNILKKNKSCYRSISCSQIWGVFQWSQLVARWTVCLWLQLASVRGAKSHLDDGAPEQRERSAEDGGWSRRSPAAEELESFGPGLWLRCEWWQHEVVPDFKMKHGMGGSQFLRMLSSDIFLYLRFLSGATPIYLSYPKWF